MRAVSTLGSGILSCVRVIHLAAQNVFWFEVDSDQPCLRRDLAAFNRPEPRSKAAIPAWALSNKPLFPTAQNSNQIEFNKDEKGHKDGDIYDASEMVERLSKKAKHWQQRY